MKKIRLSIAIILLGLSNSLYSQDKYFVKFTDKNNSPHSIDNPSEYLSIRAIERRTKQGIAITIDDLPVNPNYVQQIQDVGAKVDYSLKWFNGVVATIATNSQLNAIKNFPFVSSTTQIFESGTKGEKLFIDVQNVTPNNKMANSASTMLNYGNSYTQIKMSNGQSLHNNGFLGDGIEIAVIDAGFLEVNTHPAFDSIRTRGRILGTKDFINPNSNIYQEHSHGMMVLSTMAGYIGGQLIGTAPHAKYWLIRTENADVEQIYEEYAWTAGVEFADSVGADIINTSLGYTTFDVASQNHSYSDLDGSKTVITKAANIAASKGMAIVVSAGNDGTTVWHYISVPADSPNVLTVGAVDQNENKASFSSFGPTADGRIKPDVCAMGQGSIVATEDGLIGSANGTSFSSPIMAGMLACLWQAKPQLSARELISLVKANSNLANSPNNSIGYGVPDFASLAEINTNIIDSHKVGIYPNPFSKTLTVQLPTFAEGIAEYSIVSMVGTTLWSNQSDVTNHQFEVELPSSIPNGSYIVKVRTGSVTYFAKAIKN